jgi:hypothetical protein
MNAECWNKCQKETERLEDLSLHGRILLKWIYLSTGTGGGFF